MQMESGMVKLFGVLIPKPIRHPPNPDNTGQQLPAEFHDALRSIGADGEPRLFFSRRLYESDVKKGLTRLTIPNSRIREPFLTPEEEEYLKQKDGGGRRLKRLSVTVVDPARKVRRLTLSRWNYKKGSGGGGWSYALNGGWMEVVKENGFGEGTNIQLWSFRVNADGSLGLVICKKPADGARIPESGKKRRSTSSST